MLAWCCAHGTRAAQIFQYNEVINSYAIMDKILLHELYDSGTKQVTVRRSLMADMPHVSQQVAP